jgi:hypothetical protein
MVMTYKWSDLGKGRMLGNHVGAYIWMTTHDLPFVIGEWAGLVEDVVSNTNLSKVVK